MIAIKEDAVIVSDVHYAPYKEEFLTFLDAIQEGRIKTKQLILLGDIFDALVGGSSFLINVNRKAITRLQALSKKIEIIYFEGNHDFLLHKLFDTMTVIPLKNQPTIGMAGKNKVALAHGDYNQGLAYKVYTAIIRSPMCVSIINFLDKISNNFILRTLFAHLQEKQICKNVEEFKTIRSSALIKDPLECDWIIEGHFHQGVKWENSHMKYYNIDAFACNQSYFTVQFIDNEMVLYKHNLREIS